VQIRILKNNNGKISQIFHIKKISKRKKERKKEKDDGPVEIVNFRSFFLGRS
jgi:hypothetical protein